MTTLTTNPSNIEPNYSLRGMLGYAWRTNPTMAVFFYASIIALIISVGGMIFDPREVLGQSAWAKPTKFMLSFIVYVPTMYWLYHHVTIRPRIKSFVMHGSAAILLLELVLLVLQSARGEPMHFNVSTPFNAALWSVMGFTIMIFYVISIIGGALLVMQSMRGTPYAAALRWGTGLMLLGFGLGFLMTTPTPDQMAALEAGEQVAMIGAHTVGAPDGGVGIPLLGWSVEHGDLRVAHFVGIHGAQAMLLLGWLVTQLNLTFNRQRALVWGGGIAYGAFTLLIAWQGLRGESVVQPGALTLTSFAILAAVMMAYTVGVFRWPRPSA